ncbi:hypothetical protein NDA07_02410 [Microcoleus vaginatus DQ-U2]|uniref:hypothetical protein n=1 Tax=Microcoleus vaginatus TaxID=119532 RepID=UPI001682665A|nr:hypothetical protein [Microcoleus sp. FACHB-DQ6]
MIRSTKAASKNILSTKIVPDNTACPGAETTFIYFDEPEKTGKMALWLASYPVPTSPKSFNTIPETQVLHESQKGSLFS